MTRMTTSSPASEVADYRSLSLRRAAAPLIGVAIAIILVALVSLLAHQRTEGTLSENLHVVFWYFDVGREYNMATWYGSGLWLLLGTLAAAIATTRPRFRLSWWLFAVVALIASIDEYLELHERLDVPGGWLADRLPFDVGFTWVLVGAPIALVIGALLLRLVIGLPSRARAGLLVGGGVFAVGAVGDESINGLILKRRSGFVDNTYIYGTMVEELCEMSGLAIALASVLSLVQRHTGHGVWRLDPQVTGLARPERG